MILIILKNIKKKKKNIKKFLNIKLNYDNKYYHD